MCGIVGYTGEQPATPLLIDGLHRLEYRGYDSAGIAVQEDGKLHLQKVEGKIDELEKSLENFNHEGTTGIGHTRWATHGEPSHENAHPHFSEDEKLMIVHNGIIENHEQIRESLSEDPEFTSETDTEVLAHLFSEEYEGDLTETVRRSLQKVEGSYAVVAMHADEPGVLVAARAGSPLILGKGTNAMFAASDLPAILDYTREVVFLDDDEIATVTQGDFEVQTIDGETRSKAVNQINWDAVRAEKEGYKHYMKKEITEQPRVMRDAMRGRIGDSGDVVFPELEISADEIRDLEKIVLIACGTSYHACLVAKYWLEEFTDLQVDVDIGSEYRYRTLHPGDNELLVAVSQSGETADTLAAIREIMEQDVTTLAICNVVGSTMTREADGVIYTHAGPEIGVASTKSFTTQLVVLFLFSLYVGQCRGSVDSREDLLEELQEIPERVEQLIQRESDYDDLALDQFKKDDFLYLGRHLNYPMALEGALKLKEISYIHAEGYPAGEMKHGPIALIDEDIPVVVLSPKSRVREKMISNIEETKARKGLVIGVGMEGDEELFDLCDYSIGIPDCPELLTPMLTSVPMQLISYEIAVKRGCDVDQPRNLAKSVTVE
ncbi:MAG: glutamine--fructose-6-phosphate transaminase (isomerizing) [bacterium]